LAPVRTKQHTPGENTGETFLPGEKASGTMVKAPSLTLTALRDRYALLRVAADYDPGRLTAKATHVLYMHGVVAKRAGLDDPEELYLRDGDALEELRGVIPYWFE